MLAGSFGHLSRCLCVLALGMAACHAEPAGTDDITIRDTTDYRYCMNGVDQVIGPAKPPYYVELTCTDFHSANPLLHPRCQNIFPSSYCTIQDCEHDRQRLGTTPHPLGGTATQQYVCAMVNGSDWTLIDTLTDTQEQTPTKESKSAADLACKPISIELATLFMTATTECHRDFMKTTIGNRVSELSIPCYKTMTDSEINIRMKAGHDGFVNNAKINGKKNECEIVGNLQNSMDADLRWTK
ncbi:MAG TPA: hypothetical protein VN890_01025 [Methylocella sp.]|nr:hypothetical protein [Methylocella sp.]